MANPTNTGTANQVLRSDGNGGAVWSSEASSAEIATATGAWLADNVAQETGYVVDASLTVQNAAADAKAVGDGLAALEADLNEYVIDRYGGEFSRNLITSNDSLTQGYVGASGTVNGSSSLAYTDYLPVVSGTVLRAYMDYNGFTSTVFRYICCYDSNQQVVPSAGVNNVQLNEFTVPDGIAFVRVTLYKSGSRTNHMVTANYVATYYSEYHAPVPLIQEDFLSPDSQTVVDELKQNSLNTTRFANNYHCSLPRQKLKLTQGIPESFYYFSAVFPPKTTYVDVGAGTQYCQKHSNRIEFYNTNTLSSANGYSWRVRDALYTQIDSYNGPAGIGAARSIIAENISDCTMLVIGDSTVDFDDMTQSLLDHFESKSKTLTLLGTLAPSSNSNNRNEGRAGWWAADYLTNKTYGSGNVVNPFYNPTTQTFDFSYYMRNQNYSSPDFVVLQLGINDLSNNVEKETLWSTMKVIIDSIRDYDSGIKILYNLPSTPSSNQSVRSTYLMDGLLKTCAYDEYALAHILSEYNAANVRASYCHLVVDPDTEIRDAIHPTAAGFEKMALEVVNQINHWQNGD